MAISVAWSKYSAQVLKEHAFFKKSCKCVYVDLAVVHKGYSAFSHPPRVA